MMNGIIIYSLIPVISLIIGTIAVYFFKPNNSTISFFQHFAAGVIFAAVSLELLPELSTSHSLTTFCVGFILAIVLMLTIKALFPHGQHIVEENDSHGASLSILPLSLIAPIAIDLFIDGLLVGVSFLAGAQGGILIAAALSIEVIFLSLSLGKVIKALSTPKVILLTSGFALAILLGSGLGILITQDASDFILQGILSFGVAALLYLVTEELLVEAHEVKETPIITSSFFWGFLIIYIINKLM